MKKGTEVYFINEQHEIEKRAIVSVILPTKTEKKAGMTPLYTVEGGLSVPRVWKTRKAAKKNL